MENYNETQENKGLIAISNTLARAKDGMTMQEKKLMAIYLSKLEWKNLNNSREIWVEKSEIIKLLGSSIDYTDQSAYLRKLAQGMVHHSELHFQGEDVNEWEDIPLFTNRKSTKGLLMIKLNEDAMKLLEGLKCEYITLFLKDILMFDSNIDGSRAFTLYEFLRLHSDTRRMNTRLLTTKEIKELFDIPKDGKGSYMHYDAKKGKDVFDRHNFEKRVLDPVVAMLDRCDHVVLHNYGKDEKGKTILYKKLKKNGIIQGYEFTYTINKYPNAIKKQTILDVQAKPELLKVAQNVVDAKKTGSSKQKNSFNDYPQRNYSEEQYDDLEQRLLAAAFRESKVDDESMDGQLRLMPDGTIAE